MKGNDREGSFRSIEMPGTLTMLVLGGLIALAVATTLALLMQFLLLDKLEAGVPLVPGEATLNDSRINALGSFYTFGFWGCGILFLFWFHCAYNNLPAFGASQALGKWGAVTSFIIPVLSLFRPYQVMREIVVGSPPRQGHAQPIAMVGFWWTAYLGSNVLNIISRVMHIFADKKIPALKSATLFGIVHEVVLVGAATLAILLVRDVSARQRQPTEGDVTSHFD